MGLYDTFKTSGKLEIEGVWRDFGHCRIRVARHGGANQKFTAIMEKFAKENKRALAGDMLGSNHSLDVLENAYASAIVTEWETNTTPDLIGEERVFVSGIENPDGGELLPFTVENVKLTLHNLPDMFAELREIAMGQQFYRQALIDGAVKN